MGHLFSGHAAGDTRLKAVSYEDEDEEGDGEGDECIRAMKRECTEFQ